MVICMRDICKMFNIQQLQTAAVAASNNMFSLETCLIISNEYVMYNDWKDACTPVFDRVFKVERGWENEVDFDRYLSDKKIAAYVSERLGTAFVLDEFTSHFEEITKGYGLTYIPVESFEDKFFVSDIKNLPKGFEVIVWLDDEFMNNNDVPFNYEAYENIIEPKLPYLNPKGFTVVELVKYLSVKD